MNYTIDTNKFFARWIEEATKQSSPIPFEAILKETRLAEAGPIPLGLGDGKTSAEYDDDTEFGVEETLLNRFHTKLCFDYPEEYLGKIDALKTMFDTIHSGEEITEHHIIWGCLTMEALAEEFNHKINIPEEATMNIVKDMLQKGRATASS